jgi:hypothetical protein
MAIFKTLRKNICLLVLYFDRHCIVADLLDRGAQSNRRRANLGHYGGVHCPLAN